MAKRPDKCLRFKIVFAIIGTISGISIFFSFLGFKNINAALWGLFSALFAILVLCLLISHRNNVLLQRFPLRALRQLRYLGAFASLSTVVASITYFIIAAILKQGYKIENDGYMPAGIFALLTLKWTAMLFFHSKHYEEIYTTDEETKPITNTQESKIP